MSRCCRDLDVERAPSKAVSLTTEAAHNRPRSRQKRPIKMGEDALPPASMRRDHFLIALNLPVGRQFTIRDVYPHVYGHRLSDGAKPWPHFRDAACRKWFGLFTVDDTPIDALVWLIPFDQLAYKTA